VVYFREFEQEKRKTTIQITVNVERTQAEYFLEININDKSLNTYRILWKKEAIFKRF